MPVTSRRATLVVDGEIDDSGKRSARSDRL